MKAWMTRLFFYLFIFSLLNFNYTDLNIQIVDKLTIEMNKQARYTCNIRRSLSHEVRQTLHMKYTSFFKPWGETSALHMQHSSFFKPWDETNATHEISFVLKATKRNKRATHEKKLFFSQPIHMLDVAIIFSKRLANWNAARAMDSCQTNPSPSDPMESVCRNFPSFSLFRFAKYF